MNDQNNTETENEAPVSPSLLKAGLGSTFIDIDEALYIHERPYYRACAGGVYFSITREWVLERERLTELWHSKFPYKAAPEQKKTILQKLKSWMMPNM